MTLPPVPTWFPSQALIKTTHIGQWMEEKHFKTYEDFHRWSVTHPADFWEAIIRSLHIRLDTPYAQVLDLKQGLESPRWLTEAKLNIVKSCFQAKKTDIAIISQSETGPLLRMTYGALDILSNRVANGLKKIIGRGDKIAMIMPMTQEAVAIYLGIIKAGGVVVSIADSFAADEIETRLRIANAKVVFCQDYSIRHRKRLPLYEKIINAHPPLTIILPAEKTLPQKLRPHDQVWENFLSPDETFDPISCNPDDPINILFSSGTTGDPKAIPWTHTTPIKCASDAYFHHNLHPQDIFCWPSSLGWMMGPWLVFACLINQATLALYEGSTQDRNFGSFIQSAGVTHLGVVPTLVNIWHRTACMERLDWHRIKLFSSTGECSQVEDMLYLMSLANHCPIIEYCGGTEVGGAYITGTLVQPCAPAACTTPALGLDFLILDEKGAPADKGEIALIPPSLGLSTTLLNKDHHDIYYAGMPSFEGKPLRRHGDYAERFSNGFYRLLGRSDDTMNLGGIKVSAAEIERVLNTLPEIAETAAIAIASKGGGPDKLIIYAVPRSPEPLDMAHLKMIMQTQLSQHLNPLFKINGVIITPALPRTASNKILHRVLRDEYLKTY